MTRRVIGLHSAREVLDVRPQAVREIILRKGFERSQDLKIFSDFAKSRRLRVTVRDEGFLDKIASHHQGVCIVVEGAPELSYEKIDQLKDTDQMILLALDEISDPHNVGAILRTAWLAGVQGVLVPEMRSAHLTPATMKVASGGAEHVPLHVVSNLPSDLSYLKDKGFWIYGLAGEAGSTAITSVQLPNKVIWVVGSEERGLRSTVRKVCDELVAIPQTSAKASYNASVAAGMAIFETVRQHKNPSK